MSPGDVVVVHDPQPAGLIDTLRERGAVVVWRCHVGLDHGNEWSERSWSFLRPYVESADAFVFSRASFAPSWLDRDRVTTIPPSIDPFADKNAELSPEEVAACSPPPAWSPASASRWTRASRTGRWSCPRTGRRRPTSRWSCRSPAGIASRTCRESTAFAKHVDPALGAQLVLAGPEIDGVGDDPEGGAAWAETLGRWQSLPSAARRRSHLVAVPVADIAENALVINALQRHAAVVVQKSLAEGFGLTVAEAMWKSRPVVASAVGGIVDQVVDGDTGLLLPAPDDLPACGAAVSRLLREPREAARMGRRGRERVTELFLADRHLLRYASLLESLLG